LIFEPFENCENPGSVLINALDDRGPPLTDKEKDVEDFGNFENRTVRPILFK